MSQEHHALNEQAKVLLHRTATGDQRAYEELYRLLSNRIFAFAQRMVDNAAVAEEILMDTMLDVWNQASDFRGDSKVTTWVLGIARNKALMALRSARSKGGQAENIDDYQEVLDAEVPDGFEHMAEKQSSEIIQGCMEKLSDTHRECVHLIHFEDLSMKEVAEIQGKPEGTIKSRLSNARAKLAACVEIAQRRLGGAS